jgi:phospholipid transport system substrate-binding protein
MTRTIAGIRTLSTLSKPHIATLFGGAFLLLGLLAVLLAALLAGPMARAQDASPTAAVRSVVDNILLILRKPDFDMASDRPAISAEVKRAFDATAMAQSVLSTNWRDASTEQQNEFRDLLLQTRASVETVIMAAANQIPVTYKLRKRSDGWFVYDVEVENVSMVSSYRETYRSVVRRSGMDGLLEQMRAKVAEQGV